MQQFIDFISDFNQITVILRIILAAILGGLIGSERGRHGRAAGLRTHILVCLGAAITSLTSLFIVENLGFAGDVARLSAQVISGIGFLGAGMIMVRGGTFITGLTTAAGMWATAAIGIAVGYGFYAGAIVAAVICIFSVTVLSRLEKKAKSGVYVYIELPDVNLTEKAVAVIRQLEGARSFIDVIAPKSAKANNIGVMCILNGEEKFDELKTSIKSLSEDAILIYDINA